ncbi:MAG TPA: hypothetical protein EYP73_02850, partial [Acidimicrobiia bacterium]|nr:hypothetical protein [Acidimicrobiia bacterium]
MRPIRTVSTLLVLVLLASTLPAGINQAFADTVDEAEQAAHDAEHRAEAAKGLVNQAVANRAAIETQLAEAISRLNDLAAKLSVVGAKLDK